METNPHITCMQMNGKNLKSSDVARNNHVTLHKSHFYECQMPKLLGIRWRGFSNRLHIGNRLRDSRNS